MERSIYTIDREILGRRLVLDELFDLSLYREFAKTAKGEAKKTLEELIPIEEKHLAFWQDFFKIREARLNFGGRIRLFIFALICRIFGEAAIHLILEAIEVYGVRKYLNIWRQNQGRPLGEAVREILEDEIQHEDVVVSRLAERKINPERIRNIILGVNDGLVEIVGAVSGFFAAFQNPGTVLIASFTVAVAGAFSMAAGTFSAVGSEREVRDIEQGKKVFLGGEESKEEPNQPLSSALAVGISYFLGSLVPVLPVFFGATNIIVPFLAAGLVIALVSFVLAFLSGMEIKKRIAINLFILALAIGVTYTVGTIVQKYWGIEL